MENIVVYAADIGSIKKKHFAWCRGEFFQIQMPDKANKEDINDFVNSIVDDLKNKKKVAIGFECPLFVPITDKPEDLTNARDGENNRPWSAGAGCCALATGLTECVWIFKKIREKIHEFDVDVKPSFTWKDFLLNESNFFIWESFVTSSSKEDSHYSDAKKAVETFIKMCPNEIDKNDKDSVTVQNSYSPVGAGLLRAGFPTNFSKLLFEPWIVIKS